jgi:hypothetical protein
MKNSLIIFILAMISMKAVHAQPADIYGYFEPQYNGIYFDEHYYQFHSNKLRVDLKSTAIDNVEMGADVIFLLYHGKTDWNILDFLPDVISSTVPPAAYPFYTFSYEDTLYLDNVYARLAFERFAFTVGKQQISLGTGYFANPTDIFNTKDVLDPTYEQPGHNGIRVDLLLTPRMSIMALYSPIGSDFENSGKLLRAKLGLGHFDLSLVASESQYTTTNFYTFQPSNQGRRMLGGDVVGELLGLGVWAEGMYSFLEQDDDFYEFLIGTDYTFESGLYTMLEYHHNSLAEAEHENYNLNDFMRFFLGEIKTLARDQAYGLINYPLTDMLNIGASFIVETSGWSAAIVPTVQYSLFQNVDLTLMGNIYTGEEGTAYSSTLGNGAFLRASVYF